MPDSDAIIEELKARATDIAGERAQGVIWKDGIATVTLDVAGLERQERDRMEIDLIGALRGLDHVEKVRVLMTAEAVQRRLIAVGSGKGGVGKSTLATNLAVAMQRAGRAVGLVDADIYGPSQPRLLDCEGRRPEAQGQKLVPVPNAYGVPVLSMGHLVKPGQAVAWRGPMAGNAMGQLIDAHWGNVRDIIVDMPPGTGDIHLTMMQKYKPAGALIVSTPQDLALIDAVRAVNMFEQGKIPIIGLVENMAGYICPHCGELSDPFGSGGAEAAAKELGMDFMGRIPLDAMIRRASDAGVPPAAGEGPQADAFADLASRLIAWLDTQQAS